jgi:hypothetical protein
MTDKDRLAANPALYRAELSCRIGKDVIEGKVRPPPGVARSDWILYHLLSAVEDLARALNEKEGT